MSKDRILVVDDDDAVRSALQEMLEDDGYHVMAVGSGEAALERIADHEFDLALIDLKMPGIGGIEVLAELRQQAPDTAAIVLTAHASLKTAVEALRQGAHDYLFKPCKPDTLRESVRNGLLKRQRERKQTELLTQLEQGLQSLKGLKPEEEPLPEPELALDEEAERFLQRGGLIVDVLRHVVTLDGHLVPLSPTEFDVLSYLLDNAPRVISPQELAREVQEYEVERWEANNIIRCHIYRIRQKMREDAGHADMIRTVRGVGYTLGE